MKVKMLVQLSGSKFLLEPGDEREFPQDEAIRLVKAGFAVLVAAASELETAVLHPSAETRFSSVLKLPDAAGRAKARRSQKG